LKNFIRGVLAGLGMFWLIVLVTVLIILLCSIIEFITFQFMHVPMRTAGWLMLIVLPPIVAPPMLYVMLKQFRDLDEGHKKLFASQHQLQVALAEVKELRGMLAMCAGCKKVRDEDGMWVHVDMYLKKHTKAEISHGLCTDCVRACLTDN